MSSRIQILLNNKTSKVLPDSGRGIGAIAVRSNRGTEKPTYFKPGETLRLIELCGDPGPTYPDLLEALQYVQSYGLWVSCPSNNGRYGGVAITPTGTKKLPGGVSAIPTVEGLTTITLIERLGVGDGTTTSFGKTLGALTAYVDQSVRILSGGTALVGQAVTDDATEVITTTPNIGAGQYVKASGALTFTFVAAPAAGAVIEASYTFDLSIASTYALLFSRAPQADYLTVKHAMSASGYIFTTTLSGYDSSSSAISKETLSWSLVKGSVDAYGRPNYITEVFDNDDWIIPYVVSSTVSTFTTDATNVDFGGGSRGGTMSGVQLAAGLEYFKQARTYAADVFFDASALSEVATAFATLRTSYQKYAKYLLPTAISLDAEDAITWTPSAINRGIKCYWNWGKVDNPWNNLGKAWTPLIGEVAIKQADIIVGAFGGMALSWIDENGWGGQLSSGRVSEMMYDPDETTTDTITGRGLNPIILDPNNGVMVLSERTTITSLSDYSYGSYSGTLDYIIKNVVEQVIPAQIEKFNDQAHRDRIIAKCERIMKPMQVAPRNVLYDFAIKCDGENNDETVLNNEQLVLQIAIQVTRMARTIIVTFINSPTGTDIKEAFV